MNKPELDFVQQVRNKSLQPPTAPGFNLETWKSAWEQSSNKSKENTQLYQAGIIFFQVLRDLRSEVEELYKTPARSSKKLFIKAYCGVANRDLALLSRMRNANNADLVADTFVHDKLDSKISRLEVANGCVDAIEIGLRQLTLNLVPFGVGPTAIDSFDFFSNELAISNIYGLFESWWQALVWGDYEFLRISESEYQLRQIATDFTVAYEVSQLRKEKLGASSAFFFVENSDYLRLLDQPCLTLVRTQKRIAVKQTNTREISNQLQMVNASFLYQIAELEDHLPNEFLNTRYKDLEFTISELIEIFRLLVILSHISFEKFSTNNEISTLNNISKFTPCIKRNELLRGINQASNFGFEKCEQILNFLTYDGSKNRDLWCHPIIDLGDGEVTYLVASLHSPVMLRVIEHWLVELGGKLIDKGPSFERKVIENINSTLMQNSLFSDHEKAVASHLNLGRNKSEEIDLLFRFGKIIVIAEVKSIVTTDSPVSLFRTKQTIFKAADQIKRKADFVSQNIDQIFNKLNWPLNPNQNYQVIPLIINSNSICVGYKINNIPVCDLRILTKYFESNIIPLISTSNTNHLAWFEIYKDFQEAQHNFQLYINNPPQIQISKDDLEESTFKIPFIKDATEKGEFLFTRLLKKPLNVEGLLKKEFIFQLHLAKDFQEKVIEAKIII